MAWAATLSALALYLGDRWGLMASAYRDPIEGLSESLSPALAYEILLDPLTFSLEAVPLICGLSLFAATWYAFATFANRPAELREGDEHGSARMGSARELRGYADHRDESNNIVLSSNVSIAIEPSRGVRRRLPSQNVIVYGPSGTGKTTSFVMTNILQLADRDMVVVDPKGQTLARVGHALAAAGFEISVLNLKELAASDRYNPLAAVRDYEDAVAFAQMLVRAVNEGRHSSEPIWEQGPILLFRAVITLMLDWFPREEMTFDNLVSLVSLARTPERSPGSRSALDLLFDEIATGECWVHDTEAEENADEADPFAPAGAGAPTRRGRLVRVPSLMRRRDGMRPAREVRAGGGHGTDDDEALQVWRQFRSGATRTLQSFLVTAFSSLAHLTTRRVRELLAAEDGVDCSGSTSWASARTSAGSRFPRAWSSSSPATRRRA